VECLDGQGPDDLRELVILCAAHLQVQTKKEKNLDAARKQAERCLTSGDPRAKWNEMIVAQGADLAAFERKLKRVSTAKVTAEVVSEKSGFVAESNARILGEVIRDLGGGRFTKESSINYDVGVDRMAKPGEHVEKEGVLCRIHAASYDQAKMAEARLRAAFVVSPKPIKPTPLVVGVIQ
jgi:thymidine phosphorylase